jgi:hypothetical protein
MIRKIFTIILVLLVFKPMASAQEPKLDKILDRFYEVNGFDKLQKVKTIVMEGTITRNDVMPYKISKMRPDKFRLDFMLADLEAIQAFDGKTGWSTAPWTGNPKPTKMNEDATGGMKIRADFDGLLYKLKEKGHKAELTGKELIKNKEYYKIKLSRADGGIEYFFINSTDLYLERHLIIRKIRDKDVEVLTIYSANSMVDGIVFPFVIETLMDGQRYSLVEFEKIETGINLDPLIFNMPED